MSLWWPLLRLFSTIILVPYLWNMQLMWKSGTCWFHLGMPDLQMCGWDLTTLQGTRERFKKAYKILNLRALKFSPVNKMHIFQCMGKIFCVEFQRFPLKFHTKYLTHTLKYTIFIRHWNFKSSWIEELISVFEMPPQDRSTNNGCQVTYPIFCFIIWGGK